MDRLRVCLSVCLINVGGVGGPVIACRFCECWRQKRTNLRDLSEL